eukprot:236461-Rhodomonas_salina.1
MQSADHSSRCTSSCPVEYRRTSTTGYPGVRSRRYSHTRLLGYGAEMKRREETEGSGPEMEDCQIRVVRGGHA